MFLSGEICPSASPVCWWSGAALRVVLMGQKSAEVVVPVGIMLDLPGRAERWELMV